MIKKTLAFFIAQGNRLARGAKKLGNGLVQYRWTVAAVMVIASVLIPVYFLLDSPYAKPENQVTDGKSLDGADIGNAKQDSDWPVAVEEPAAPPTDDTSATPAESNAEEESKPALNDMVLPATGQVVTGYGFNYSQEFADYRFHDGLDLSVQRDMPVGAVLPGEVTVVEYAQLYGYRVTVDHGSGWQTRYANLAKVSVERGDQVEQGDQLGTIGDPGTAEAASGTHVHMELLSDGESVNPSAYLPLAE
ncbi:M23 family metallopeptidase [Metallumcola ferriviriculae]|uniref:M23 family metallopeptidase n=1 Tax=Metallumcola ferriviriculae TaxID=3039180 RepID=A0AAU0UHQ9_9FIRM|nr:M23 family metallopeptidase [Desulfitibacteraceae bacterium MK1]